MAVSKIYFCQRISQLLNASSPAPKNMRLNVRPVFIIFLTESKIFVVQPYNVEILSEKRLSSVDWQVIVVP